MYRLHRGTDEWTDIAKLNSGFSQFWECTQKLLILPALCTIHFIFYIYPQQNIQLMFETLLGCITALIWHTLTPNTVFSSLFILFLLLLKALQLQRSLGLLNKCFQFCPIFDATFPICQLHPDKVALNINLPSVFWPSYPIYCIKSQGYGHKPSRINRFSGLQNF